MASIQMSQSLVRVLATWDLENTKAPHGVTPALAAANITKAFETLLGNKPVIEFCGAGVTDQFSSKHNAEYEAGGIRVEDVPDKAREAADKSLIVGMFEFALNVPPPACILLISKDKDFGRAVTTLSRLAYTIIVALEDNATHKVVQAYEHHTIVSWNTLASGGGFVRRNSYPYPYQPIHILDLLQPQREIPHYQRGTGYETAVFWDALTCPCPQNIEPNMVYDYIRNSIISHPLIKTTGNIKPFNVYQDSRYIYDHVRSTWQATGISFINTPNDVKEDRLDKKILVEVLEFAWNQPAPCNIMVITADSSLSPGLCALRNRGYSVILATPTGGDVTLLDNAGSILFSWPHQEDEINDDLMMWAKPGDASSLTRNIEDLLREHNGIIKLDDVALQYQRRFRRPLVASEFNCRTIENMLRDLMGSVVIEGDGSNKIVRFKDTLSWVDASTDDLQKFIASFTLGIPLSIFEAIYGQQTKLSPLENYYRNYGVTDVEGLCRKHPDVAMLIQNRETRTKRVMFAPVVIDRRKRLERDIITLLEAYQGKLLFHYFEHCYKEMFRGSIFYDYYGLTDLQHLCEVFNNLLKVEEVTVQDRVPKEKMILLFEYR